MMLIETRQEGMKMVGKGKSERNTYLAVTIPSLQIRLLCMIAEVHRLDSSVVYAIQYLATQKA